MAAILPAEKFRDSIWWGKSFFVIFALYMIKLILFSC